MAKLHTVFICQTCGHVQPKWSGQCQGCMEWNTLIEEVQQGAGSLKKATATTLNLVSLDAPTLPLARYSTGLGELDRVLGGGMVPGSVVLVGGDPGIGKSTLLLQVAALFSHQSSCYYISGEEATDQVRLRASRLGVQHSPVMLASHTDLTEILRTLKAPPIPQLVVIDSIQTMVWDHLDAAAGSVSQVRACSQELIKFAKKTNTVLILVGHVTKEGTLAGPRVLEHMVDTVLYFEGERTYHYRILRSVKNRYGATDEMGVFEMTQQGLKEVSNPSLLFLPDRQDPVSGSVIYAGMEGTRPLLMEIQALVSPGTYGTPRRSVLGWDPQRLAMILAVLETRANLSFGSKDVYLNVTGGMRIQEPGADLAIAAALISALLDQPLPQGALFFGEIGLSGEIRGVSFQESRLKEAAKLGFTLAIMPKGRDNTQRQQSINRHETVLLTDLLSFFDFSTQPSKRIKHAS